MRIFSWIVMVPVAIFVIAFSVANRAEVGVDLWPFEYVAPVPLFVAVLGAAFAGFVAGAFVAWISGHGGRRRGRAASRRAVVAEREIQRLREHVQKLEDVAAPAAPGKPRGPSNLPAQAA